MTNNNIPQKRRKKKRRRVNRLNLWTLILAFIVVCEIIVSTVGLVMLSSMLSGTQDLVVDDFFSAESTHIYDSEGTLIADVGTTIRENVTYDELSESLIDAFLAVEDSRFFEHDGFDMPRFIKSAITNVKNIITGSSSRQGGSTFTMQLVKLVYFQNDETGTTTTKDIEYKVQQISLARELETKSNKKAIFEMYLNKMNFGGTGNIRGIEKAAQYYYGKHASELNLAESAMLAGVINSPYYYDPHNFLDYATSRRNTVLYLMKYHGYITQEEYELACSIKVEDTLIDPDEATGSTYAYQSYIDVVIQEAEELTGQDPLSVAMDIYTCMDADAQAVMDDIQAGNNENVVYPDDLMEVAMISENNQTGEIVAIGGGRNYGRGGSMLLNHATDQYKQPGSSIKPVVDYALAFEYLGWSTSHVVTDKPIQYAGTNFTVQNASGSYGGQMTLQYAISMSLNTPAIQTLQEVVETAGWQTVVDYIQSLGFSQVSENNFDLGFAIGGSTFTCSAEELMAANAVIMNGGYYIEPHTIKSITFRNGSREPITPTYEKVQVLSEEAAYLTSVMMKNVVTDYVYTRLLARDYPVYAKTGTTDWGTEGLQYNIPSGASKDKWMVSETSQYTTVVWVGYEKGVKDAGTYFNTEKQNMNIQGKISNEILSVLNDSIQPSGVQQPEGVTTITHILGTFPYAAPIEGMDSSLITTGYIKKDKATLVEAEGAADVEALAEDGFTIDGSTLMAYFAEYPDADKLTVADSTMDISLYDSNGNMIVEAWGNRIFDYSWIYGPIRYKIRITQNGEVKGEIVSEWNEISIPENIALDAGTETLACGYYGYESGSAQSNEVCYTFTTPAEEKEEEPENTPSPTPDESTEPSETPEESTSPDHSEEPEG